MIGEIKLELESSAIFNSGESDGNTVQIKTLADDNGLVYLHAKTFKGQLKNHAMWIYEKYKKVNKDVADEFLDSINYIFGFSKIHIPEGESGKINTDEDSGLFRFGNLEYDDYTKNELLELIREKEDGYILISKSDLIDAQTRLCTNIRLQDGVVEDNGIVSFQAVKEGLTFYSKIEYPTESPIKHIENFEKIVRSFNRVGANTNRGRGYCKCFFDREVE